MKTYVIHYTPLFDRRRNIEILLKELNLEAEFITRFDKEKLDLKDKKFLQSPYIWIKEIKEIKDVLINNIIYNKNISIKSKIYWYLIKNSKNLFFPKCFKFRKLNPAEISLSLKHYIALKKIELSNEPGLIIEDDVLLDTNTKDLLNKASKLCYENFDYIDLGGGCNLPLFHADNPYKNDKRFTCLDIPRSRTTAAYILNPKTAKLLSNGLFPISLPIDWKYQNLFIKNKLKVAWAVPPAFIHGSENLFKSSIR